MKTETLLVLACVVAWSAYHRAHADELPVPQDSYSVECRMTKLAEKPLIECAQEVHEFCRGAFVVEEDPEVLDTPKYVAVTFNFHCDKGAAL